MFLLIPSKNQNTIWYWKNNPSSNDLCPPSHNLYGMADKGKTRDLVAKTEISLVIVKTQKNTKFSFLSKTRNGTKKIFYRVPVLTSTTSFDQKGKGSFLLDNHLVLFPPSIAEAAACFLPLALRTPEVAMLHAVDLATLLRVSTRLTSRTSWHFSRQGRRGVRQLHVLERRGVAWVGEVGGALMRVGEACGRWRRGKGPIGRLVWTRGVAWLGNGDGGLRVGVPHHQAGFVKVLLILGICKREAVRWVIFSLLNGTLKISVFIVWCREKIQPSESRKGQSIFNSFWKIAFLNCQTNLKLCTGKNFTFDWRATHVHMWHGWRGAAQVKLDLGVVELFLVITQIGILIRPMSFLFGSVEEKVEMAC